ncbi:MAG: DUF58 domain-containing protein [Defluviitaleaceae bacterium]|nr:DUF58 domain-containing protein [Defluviitaleaceae bacterium]
MSVTKNYVLLTALGGIITLATWPLGFHGLMFLFWNVLLLGLLLLDMIMTPGKKLLSVRRQDKEATLYFKAENSVAFYIKNSSRYVLLIEGKDELHRHFRIVAGDLLNRAVKPRAERIFEYTTIPAKRGSFGIKNIYLRWQGLLGLCVKHATYLCPAEFKVYPNVRDLSKYRLMVQKSRLLPLGDKSIRHYGLGAEFESQRAYVEGDDYRKINWLSTARENRLIVNQFQIERNQPVFILLDIGRPMSYSVKGFKKLDYAINAALILGDIVNQQGDKTGLMVFDSQVRAFIAPGQGAGHKNQLMETLYHVADNRSTADYEGAFRSLCEKQKRRSLVFIFTDFEILEEAQNLIAHMKLLKKRHLPIVVFMRNENLDAMAEQPVYKEFDRVLRDTAREFQDERRDIFRTLHAMGIPNVESTAENFAVEAVNRYMQLRRNG